MLLPDGGDTGLTGELCALCLYLRATCAALGDGRCSACAWGGGSDGWE